MNTKLTEVQVKEAIRLYTAHNIPPTRIAEMMGVDESTIRNYLKKSGIKARPVGRPHLLTQEQVDHLIDLYCHKHTPSSRIAEIIGVSADTVLYYIKKNGIQRRLRGRPHLLTKTQVDQIIDLYCQKRIAATRIAEMMGVYPKTILRYLKQNGVQVRAGGKTPLLNQEQVVQIIYLYRQKNTSAARIAEMIGVSAFTIIRCLKKNGVEIRSRNS